MGLRASDGGVQLLLLFSLLHFWFSPRYLLCLFELKSISGLRTRPRSTGNRGQLALPLLPPSVSRCEVGVGQPAQVNSRTEKGSCCSLWGRSPADLLFNHHTFTCCSPGLVPEQQIFLSGTQFLYLSDTLVPSGMFFFSLKYQLKVILDSINH